MGLFPWSSSSSSKHKSSSRSHTHAHTHASSSSNTGVSSSSTKKPASPPKTKTTDGGYPKPPPRAPVPTGDNRPRFYCHFWGTHPERKHEKVRVADTACWLCQAAGFKTPAKFSAYQGSAQYTAQGNQWVRK